jgi:hypothetical protein
MNEIMQMKNQMNQMMQTIKQKDELINQQNMKLAQFGTSFGGTNNASNLNNMPNISTMNNIPNMQGMNNLQGQGFNNMNNIPGMNNMPNMQGINNLQGMNNINPMNNMNFLGNQPNQAGNPINNNGGFQYNFPQFKSNDTPNPSSQYPSNNKYNNKHTGRRISPFLSMNLNNKPF